MNLSAFLPILQEDEHILRALLLSSYFTVLMPPFITVRRMVHLRTVHRSDLAWRNVVSKLINEVERQRTELLFFKAGFA